MGSFLPNDMSPGEGQSQKTDQPSDALGSGQMGLFEVVSPRFERRKHRLNLPALLVQRRRLLRIDSPSGQNEKLILCLLRVCPLRSGSNPSHGHADFDRLSVGSGEVARSFKHFFFTDGKRPGQYSSRQRRPFWRPPNSAVRAQANRKRNLAVLKPAKPCGRDKLSIGNDNFDVRGCNNIEKSPEHPALIVGRGASLLRQDRPADRKGNSFMRNANHQDIHWGVPTGVSPKCHSVRSRMTLYGDFCGSSLVRRRPRAVKSIS